MMLTYRSLFSSAVINPYSLYITSILLNLVVENVLKNKFYNFIQLPKKILFKNTTILAVYNSYTLIRNYYKFRIII